jgi:hypothetical protein
MYEGYRYDPTLKQTRRVGGWLLEWHPSRPGLCWAIPEYLKTFRRCESGIMYDDGRIAWDTHYGVPQYVKSKVSAFIIECQQKHNTTTEAERG